MPRRIGLHQVGAAVLGLIAAHSQIPARYVAYVVAGNALSCAALLVLAFADVIPLTGLGVAFLLTGALVVAVYAALEYVGLRRLPRGGSA
ncbi:hypothetical protein ACIBP6_46355 [Nonomuraea terrae]|uniref:hypothetical protein n=1 Tax=Nonomuraea terrae TaxID=2530383 RepID=UPI0037A65AED